MESSTKWAETSMHSKVRQRPAISEWSSYYKCVDAVICVTCPNNPGCLQSIVASKGSSYNPSFFVTLRLFISGTLAFGVDRTSCDA